MPTSGDEPCRPARPWAERRGATRSHFTPAPPRTLWGRAGEPVWARVADGGEDVVGTGREGDRRGMLVEQEVECRAGLVPAGIAGEHDGAREDFGERGVRGGGEHAPMVGRSALA